MPCKVLIEWVKGRGGRTEKGKATIKAKSQRLVSDAVHAWKREPENRGKQVVKTSVS